MKILLLVPRVVSSYIAQFPEVRNNAYKYFNYDNRVVEKSVNRFDKKPLYKGPEQFSDADYGGLVNYASTLINPILMKYSQRVAKEDALHMAIRSYSEGLFDGKVNASRYEVLLKAVGQKQVMAKKKAEPEPATAPVPVTISPKMLKDLGIMRKEVPMKRKRFQGIPHIVREKGRVIVNKS
jgi:hypothetical protein